MASTETTVERWAFRIGAVFLALSLVSPLLAFAVPWLELSDALEASLIGLLVLGIPEIFLLIAAALMGKRAIEAIKARIARVFKRTGPPRRVGRTRFRIGMAILFGSALPLLLHNYATLGFELTVDDRWLIAGDAAFIASFFVLGAEWWERLKRLFRYDPGAPALGGPKAVG
jgi:hypothetical protein